MKTSHIEILAPTGSFESLTTAIKAGCNAIYFGISDMNMRATAAANFKIEDLPEITRICRENNVRCYITLNTLIYDNNRVELYRIIDAVKENNVDAIIASDMATIMYAREKGVEVHISTQLSVSNIESVKFYATVADRIVLARELSLEQVAGICSEIQSQDIRGPKGNLVEIEVFAHGALCVAVSGRCSMSLFCYNTSANCGRCTQICRRRYKVTDIDTNQELVIDNNYVMSAADLCTIGMLDKLVESGVTVLKFEGRGRSPEYVDTVIRTYKAALESIEKDEYTPENIEKWNKDLGTVFNRGMNTGFYMGRKFDEWSGVHGSKATKEKLHIGKIQKYYPKIQVAEILIQAADEIQSGEEYLIIGKSTGTVKGVLSDMHIDEKVLDIAKQNDVITIKVEEKVHEGDLFYVVRDRKSFIPRGHSVVS